jgi:hypothetical protein
MHTNRTRMTTLAPQDDEASVLGLNRLMECTILSHGMVGK